MKSLLFLLLAMVFSSQYALSNEVMNDLESLGATKSIIKRAKALDPENRVRIVQKREVDRNTRLEVGIGMGYLSGGDPYLNTKSSTIMLDFHITPKFSIGARYSYFDNDLSAEGKNLLELAENNPAYANSLAPDFDAAKDEAIATVSFFPLYGKLNWFDSAVQQFDLYITAGAGQVNLESGPTATGMAGVGIGLWFNKYLSSRLEVIYQQYEDQISSGPRSIENLKIGAAIGFML